VVSSGEVASYNSVSEQTIASQVRHLAEFKEAVALAASFFSATSFFACYAFHRTLFGTTSIFAATDISGEHHLCAAVFA
jgi:hypothetical protein